MVYKYKKKSATIEALQWNGDGLLNNITEMLDFLCNSECTKVDQTNEVVYFNNSFGMIVSKLKNKSTLRIKTPEGAINVVPKNYIIKDTKNNFHSCNPDVFLKTYEQIK